jgi:hypothetical protein
VGAVAEAQSTAAWTNQCAFAALTANQAAALAGTTYGLQATVTGLNGASSFCEDQTPADEGRYRARFYFRPNTLDPGIAAGQFRTRVFTAIDDSAPGGGTRRTIMVALQRQTAVAPYRVLARVYLGTTAPDPNNPYQVVGPFDLTGDGNTTHWVEVDWQRNTAGQTNGSFRMWVDSPAGGEGTPTGQIANYGGVDAFGIDTARLGFIVPQTAATGVVHLDEFESRRQTYIGPRQ